jgi:hypothetical protein
MNRQKMTDNMKQHNFVQTEARTANIGIANSGAGHWNNQQR